MNSKAINDFVYYLHDGAETFRFKLAGDLSAEVTTDLEQARETALSIIGSRSVVVDLTNLSNIDAAGRSLLQQWHESGARLTAASPAAQQSMERSLDVPVTLSRDKRSRCRLPLFTAALWLAAFGSLVGLGASLESTCRYLDKCRPAGDRYAGHFSITGRRLPDFQQVRSIPAGWLAACLVFFIR